MATSNNLKFPEVPESIKFLSPLEESMVSPFINFMQICALKSYALNPQFGIKGSLINIPIEVNKFLEILPRSFNDMDTI